MSYKIFKILQYVLLVVVVVLLFLGIFLLLLFYLSQVFLKDMSSPPNVSKSFHNYQVNEVNAFEKTSRRGFVTLPKELEQEEYISYFNEEIGSNVIITNFFDGTEYRCSGNCFCLEPSEHQMIRRTFPGVSSRGLIAFFSALSVSMAINLARETFYDQCSHEFKQSCSFPYEVEVEIEECSRVEKMSEIQGSSTNQKAEGEKEEEKRDTSTIPDGKAPDGFRFQCHAHCLPLEDPFVKQDTGSFFQGEEFLRIGHQNVGLCEAKAVDSEIVVPYKIQGVGVTPEQAHRLSKVVFVQQFPLHGWCISQSKMKYEWFSEEGQNRIKEYLQKISGLLPGAEELFIDPFFCYGYKVIFEQQHNAWMANEDFHNINCVSIS